MKEVRKMTQEISYVSKNENVCDQFEIIEPWAQSYILQIPENFRFSEPKILFVIEATLLVKKWI